MSSLVDRSRSRECFHSLKLQGEEALICQEVTRTDKKKKDAIVLFCTTGMIAFFEKGKSLSLMEKFVINQISIATLIDKKNVQMSMGHFSIAFEHPNALLLFKSIVSHLKGILTRSELPTLKYDQKLTGNIPGSSNMMNRFCYLNKTTKMNVPASDIDKLKSVFTQKKLKTLDLGAIAEM